MGRPIYCSWNWEACQSISDAELAFAGKCQGHLAGYPAMYVCRSGPSFFSIALHFVFADNPNTSFLCEVFMVTEAISVLRLSFMNSFVSSENWCFRPPRRTRKLFMVAKPVLKTSLAHGQTFFSTQSLCSRPSWPSRNLTPRQPFNKEYKHGNYHVSAIFYRIFILKR